MLLMFLLSVKWGFGGTWVGALVGLLWGLWSRMAAWGFFAWGSSRVGFFGAVLGRGWLPGRPWGVLWFHVKCV